MYQHSEEALVVYQHSEEALKSLKPVCLALNKVQGHHVTVAGSVAAWKALLAEFRLFGSEAREWIELAEKRYFNTLGAALFTAYAIHPRYFGRDLSSSEWKETADWVEKEYPLCFSYYMNFIGGGKNNLEQTFRSSNCEIGNFYRAQVLMVTVPEVFSDMCLRLLALVPTSAGPERIFSTMGIAEDVKRNNLDSAKTAKVSFCMRALNDRISIIKVFAWFLISTF